MTDLNLLRALDALLSTQSVTKAAARLHVTVPAMSRSLARLRVNLSDELLVRAGRSMVLTPRAEALRDAAPKALHAAQVILSPGEPGVLQTLRQTLVIRCHEALVALLATPLHTALAAEALQLEIRFVGEGDEDALPLRDGRVDLDLGVNNLTAPELKKLYLGRDEFVGVMKRKLRSAPQPMTLQRFCQRSHLGVSRKGQPRGPIDTQLELLGRERTIAFTVSDFLSALYLVSETDLLTSTPSSLARALSKRLPLHIFRLPIATPHIQVAMVWHPRLDGDAGHAWLRRTVQRLAKQFLPPFPQG
jgi:DNA-binding transcriptional LysR family regulator